MDTKLDERIKKFEPKAVQLDGEEIVEVWGVVSWVVSCVAA